MSYADKYDRKTLKEFDQAYDNLKNSLDQVAVALENFQNVLEAALPKEAKILVNTLAQSGPSWAGAVTAKALSYAKGMPEEWRFPATARYVGKFKDMFDKADLLVCGDPAESAIFADQMLASALAVYSPSQCMFYFVDPGRTMLVKYKELPHTIAYIDDVRPVPALLDRVNRYVRWNKEDAPSLRTKGTRLRHLYLVISDLEGLLSGAQGSKIQSDLRSILQKGMSAKVHVIAFAGTVSGAEIPLDLRRWFTYRAELLSDELCYKDPKRVPEKLCGFHDALTAAEIEERIRFWVCQRTDAP